MEVLERAAVAPPQLRTERAQMESLKGEVIVRGRLLAQTLELYTLQASALEPREGETPEQAKVRAGAELVAHALAHQVVLADGQPMWTAQQWLIHGGEHPQEVVALHAVAQRLAGAVTEDVEKNSEPSPGGEMPSSSP